MRTVHALAIISAAVPLALMGCSKDNDPQARSANDVSHDSDYPIGSSTEPHDSPAMTPASRTEEAAPATIPPPENEGTAPEAQAATLDDAQIIALTDATNTAEVDAAKLALEKAKNVRVRKFAQLMIDHHGKAKQDQARLAKKLAMEPAESTKLRDLKRSATDTERTLNAAPDDMFDKVYIDIQVADHQMVLDALDREFIPTARNPELKKSLTDFRPKVQAHLNQALELRKMLMSQSSGSKNTSGSSGDTKSSGGNDSTGTTGQQGSQGTGSGSPKGAGTAGGAAPNRR